MSKQQKLSVETTRKRLEKLVKEAADLAVRGSFENTNGMIFVYDASFVEKTTKVDDVGFAFNCSTPLALATVMELRQMAMQNGEIPLAPFYSSMEITPVDENGNPIG